MIIPININVSSVYSLVIFLLVLATLHGSISADQQPDKTWHPLGSGLNHNVNAFVIFEDDLIASGAFTLADGQSANRVALWNGSGWQPLGDGMNEMVFELALHNGELFAGGNFLEADGNEVYGIARWDGAEWQPLAPAGMNEATNALFSYDGDLIAGGRFTMAGDQTVNHVARWDGEEWHPMGSGVGNSNHRTPDVQAFTIYQGDLVAGGSFDLAGGEEAHFIARWDGSTWHPVGSGLQKIDFGGIYDFTIYEGNLVAAGRFNMADGETTHAARLINGEWQPMGTGISAGALEIFEGELYVAGLFINEDSELENRIARWDGSAWQPVGVADAGSNALITYRGNLVAGGMFTTKDGEVVNHVARWSVY